MNHLRMGRLLYGAHPSACPLPNILAVHLQPFRASRSCSPPVRYKMSLAKNRAETAQTRAKRQALMLDPFHPQGVSALHLQVTSELAMSHIGDLTAG